MITVELYNFSPPQFATVPKPTLSKVGLMQTRMFEMPGSIQAASEGATLLILLKDLGLVEFLASTAWEELKRYVLAMFEPQIKAGKREAINWKFEDQNARASVTMELSQIPHAEIDAKLEKNPDGSMRYRMNLTVKPK